MDPGKALLRGVRIGVSNGELAVIGLAARVITVFALLVPLGAWGLSFGVLAVKAIPSGAEGLEALLSVSEALLSRWPLVCGAILFGMAWAGILLFASLYLQAGIAGCVARAHREGPWDEAEGKARWKASPALKRSSGGLFWSEVRANGWRVTVLAAAYSLAWLFFFVLFSAWAALCVKTALNGGALIALGIIGIVAALLPLILVSFLLAVHFRFALMCCVQRSLPWLASVRRANAVLATSPLAALAVVGATLGARYLLGLVLLLAGLPLMAMSVVPAAAVFALLPHLALSLIQGLARAAIDVAALGATAALCEPNQGQGTWDMGQEGRED